MKRRWLAMVAGAAAFGSVVSFVPAPTAHAAELVQVCITLNPRDVSVTIAGNTIINQHVDGQPRNCVGV